MKNKNQNWELNLVLELPPSLNSLYTNRARYDRRSGRYIATGGKVLSKKGREARYNLRKQAREQMKQQGVQKTKNEFLYMDVIIYFNRKGRDSDNILKSLQDSLESVVFENDSYVLPRIQRVYIDRERPRIEIKITEVDYIGIFNSLEELNSFEERCSSCNRYLNGRCSILNKAKTGEITPDLEKGICQSYKKKLS